jgi:hypothetical protein
VISNKFNHLPTNQPYILENATCVYCGYEFLGDEWTKEHVIGRKFVPKGKFNGQWNLIVRACKKCNGLKSDLENDISAISMQPDASEKYAINDSDLIREAQRKAKNSISRRTRKAVEFSKENMTLSTSLGGIVKMDFNFKAPPQMDSQRMFELARLQLIGFFYMLTYQKNLKKGFYWVGSYIPILEAIREDWGNPVHKWFMNHVLQWEPRLIFVGADGFFKVAIRRSPHSEVWSWGLEWNHNYRLVGFFGDKNKIQQISQEIPSLNIDQIATLRNGFIRMRSNIPLDEREDVLFEYDEQEIV